MQTHIPRNYRQQPHRREVNKMFERRKKQLEESEIELKNTLRWEDDGAQIVEDPASKIVLHTTLSVPVNGALHEQSSQD